MRVVSLILSHGNNKYFVSKVSAVVCIVSLSECAKQILCTMCMLQFVGTWVSGVREGTGEIMFPSYNFQGNFSQDRVCKFFSISYAYTYVSITTSCSLRVKGNTVFRVLTASRKETM